jgi:hypothetical protein
MSRPESERSPTVLAHETARSQRMAELSKTRASDPIIQGAPDMAHLILALSLDVARKRGRGQPAAHSSPPKCGVLPKRRDVRDG